MIDCPNADVRDLLPAFALDRDRLSGNERVTVESHLATCPACREELGLLESVRRAYAHVPAVDVGRVVAALPRPGSRVHRRSGLPVWQRAAAVALVVVGATAMWLIAEPSTGGPARDDVDSTLASASVTTEPAPMPLGHELSELSTDDLEALLGALDELEALPSLDPVPMIEPLGGEEGT